MLKITTVFWAGNESPTFVLGDLFSPGYHPFREVALPGSDLHGAAAGWIADPRTYCSVHYPLAEAEPTASEILSLGSPLSLHGDGPFGNAYFHED